ncbi:MAG: metallophosphoesterase family protein [Candidatus Diapherotrites archaeon]|nr:metallophosphoesterase family protein [Candidatus Diapherotrites archaeon]
MRYLLIADVHGNLHALNAVLAAAQKTGYERALCLGDIVGYNARPNECIERLRNNNVICIQGNHDAASVGEIPLEEFNPEAAECIKWTKPQLTAQNKKFLSELPRFFSMQYMLALHGSPENPLWGYMDEEIARNSLRRVPEALVICGHVHMPFYYEANADSTKAIIGNSKVKCMGRRIVVSLPSVGQPRDGDKNAGFGILDTETRELEIFRVEYDVKKTYDEVLQAGLPRFEAERLLSGM